MKLSSLKRNVEWKTKMISIWSERYNYLAPCMRRHVEMVIHLEIETPGVPPVTLQSAPQHPWAVQDVVSAGQA